MDDTFGHWCTYCDKALSPYNNTLYCSEQCLRDDALSHHPLLGYDYSELQNFPRSFTASPALSISSTSTSSSYTSLATLNSPTVTYATPPSNKPKSAPTMYITPTSPTFNTASEVGSFPSKLYAIRRNSQGEDTQREEPLMSWR